MVRGPVCPVWVASSCPGSAPRLSRFCRGSRSQTSQPGERAPCPPVAVLSAGPGLSQFVCGPRSRAAGQGLEAPWPGFPSAQRHHRSWGPGVADAAAASVLLHPPRHLLGALPSSPAPSRSSARSAVSPGQGGGTKRLPGRQGFPPTTWPAPDGEPRGPSYGSSWPFSHSKERTKAFSSCVYQ